MIDRAVRVDEPVFKASYPERPFGVRHGLVGHPLLTVEKLLELAKRLPKQQIEYNSGELPVGQDPAMTPATGLSVEDTIARIRDCRSWMVLKLIERDPEYRELLNESLDPITARADMVTPDIGRREGYIFLSSPGSVTPYHVDNEHNFLLQIQGSKTIHVWPPDDRQAISEEQLERYHRGAHRNLAWRDELAARSIPFNMRPGDGVFVPITAPHWVKNGPEVSISLSITFRSHYSDIQTNVYRANGLIRRIGLKPRPFKGGDSADLIKWNAMRVADRVGRVLGRG